MEDSDLTGKIIGCAMKVHTTLGNGFPEVVYQRALAVELSASHIAFSQEFDMPIYYQGSKIGSRRVDFLVEERIPVELKAQSAIENAHLAQAINYLEAYDLRIGLLLNFGAPSLEIRRLRNKKYVGKNSDKQDLGNRLE
jgi:GxxExxY protein